MTLRSRVELRSRIGRLVDLMGRGGAARPDQFVSVLAEAGPPAEVRPCNPWLDWLILRVPPGTPAGSLRAELTPGQRALIGPGTLKVLIGMGPDDL